MTRRRIRPPQTEYSARVRERPAWFDLRDAFRVFRVDRIEAKAETAECFALVPGRTYPDYLATLRIREDEAG